VGGDGAADADGTRDAAVDGDRHGAAPEHERVVTERGDVAREELTALVEPFLEIKRGGLESRAGVGLGAGDLGGDPQGTVHAVTGDEVARVVHDGDGHAKAELLSLDETTLDALDGLSERQ